MRTRVAPVLVSMLMVVTALAPVGGRADGDGPYGVRIAGVAEFETLEVGRWIPLRAEATNATGELWGEAFAWYADTTVIGDEREILWRVVGEGRTEIRVEVSDDLGNTASASVNVTVIGRDAGDDPSMPLDTFLTVSCLVVALAVVVLLIVLFVVLERRRNPLG